MEDSKKSSIPAWQQAKADADATSETEGVTLEHARRFLDDESVKAAAPDEKRAFLKSKGLNDAQVAQLLDEPAQESQSVAPSSAVESSATLDNVDRETDAPPDSNEASSTPADSSSPASSPHHHVSRIPHKASRPPPLITPSRVANILAVSGGVWALLYGISGLVVKPMVDNLNEARSEYYEHVNGKLSQLVDKLEAAASEVPYKNGKPLKYQLQDRALDDNESTTSDPTELFHRDIGTQTSPPPSIIGTTSNASNSSEKPVDIQANRLSAISASLRELTAMHTQKAESNSDLRSAIGEIRDQVDKLSYPPVQDFLTFGGLGYGQSAEPDDEFKKTKDAIRSVKGIFLSSRSFPAVATR
ncbi:hypothetical protein CIB48_g7532 [Xylaria polymorpha]|nr:hypothetical protein CIB48_g7532 [Xylaria polymorpha]